MSLRVGFILDSPEPGMIRGLDINGFPSRGVFMYPGRRPQEYQLEMPLGFVSRRGSELGQGGLEWGDEFHLVRTATEVAPSELAGGFLCASEMNPIALERVCRLELADCSVYPFVISPEDESDPNCVDVMARGERFRKRYLKVHVWYPIELRQKQPELGMEIKESVAYGVMKMSELNTATGMGTGVVRYVYEDDWNTSLQRVRLCRYQRDIGDAVFA